VNKLIAVLSATVALMLVAPPPSAHACHDATQFQLYPLGVSGSSLIGMAVHKSFGGNEHIELTVTASLVRIDGKGVYKHLAKLGTRMIPWRTYERDMAPLIDKAVQIARKLPGFAPVRMTSWTQCAHRTKCDGVAVTRGKRLGIAVGSRHRTTHHPLSMTYKRPADYEIGTVRRYTSGKHSWLVADLRAGGYFCSSLMNQRARAACSRSRQTRNHPEPTLSLQPNQFPLHHGHDIAIALPLP
jgi:hypothetical protein